MEPLNEANELGVSTGERRKLTTAPSEPHAPRELALSYCPRCSARLASRSCKLICPDCGYYMSCSDFY